MLGVLSGPGHHCHLLQRQLTKHRVPYILAAYWPKFKVSEFDVHGNEKVLATSYLFDFLYYLLVGLWNKLPYRGKRRFYIDILFPVYDRLASRHFKECDLLIGWSQVSLHTMRLVKSKGGSVILEHPMPHANFWNRIIQEEVSLHALEGVEEYYSLWTTRMVNRMRLEYKEANRINLLSTFAKTTFTEEGIDSAKLLITPLGNDSTHNNDMNPEISKDTFKVLFVGRLELWKGIHYLLEAFAALQLNNAELILVGAIKAEAQPFLDKYRGSYQYLGVKSSTELAAIYQDADVLVLPSINEAFGLVIIEAMSFGLPVIATVNTAAPDIIDEGIDGYTIPVRSVKALKEKITELYYMSEQSRNDIRKNAREKVKKEFSERAYGNRIMAMLEEYEGSLYSQ